MAKLSKSSTPIGAETIAAELAQISMTIFASEGFEWAGLAVDAAHPLKHLQLKDKFEKFVNKIGLGNVTGVVGASLVAASISPLLSRYWNKISKVQLPNASVLIDMWRKGTFEEKILDEYLKEHGLDDNFAKGMKELAWKVPNFDMIASAYMRFVNEGKIDLKAAEVELEKYLDVFDLRDKAREGFTFSEHDLFFKMLYRGLSRFERRYMNATGQLTKEDLEKILTADLLRSDLVPKLAKAELLQGSVAWRMRIVTEIQERVRKGFALEVDFKKILQEADFTSNLIGYAESANKLDIQTTIDEARLKEADTNYTQAFIQKEDYVKIVTDVIKNEVIRKQYIELADLARKRFDLSQVRDEKDRIITLDLTSTASGAMSLTDFIKVCLALKNRKLTEADKGTLAKAESDFNGGAMKRDDYLKIVSDTIKNDETTLLVETAILTLDGKIRDTRFKTYQTQFAKGHISSDTFVTKAVALPMSKALALAVRDRIQVQLTPRAK
jgi:hypothetical protein